MFSCCACENKEDEITIATPETSEEQRIIDVEKSFENSSGAASKHRSVQPPPDPLEDDVAEVHLRGVTTVIDEVAIIGINDRQLSRAAEKAPSDDVGLSAAVATTLIEQTPPTKPTAVAPAELYAAPPEPYAAPPEPYAAPAEPYAAPAEPYAAPAEPYAAPAEPYAAPAEPYAAPAEPYAAPAEPYAAPAEPYAAPAEPYAAPAEPYAAPAERHTKPQQQAAVTPSAVTSSSTPIDEDFPPKPLSVRVASVQSLLHPTASGVTATTSAQNIPAQASPLVVPKSPQFSRQMIRRDMSEPVVDVPKKSTLSNEEFDDHPLFNWLTTRFDPEPAMDTAPRLTPEEKRQKQERFRELVRHFAMQAVRGVECTYFDHASGDKTGGEYTVDKEVKSFGLKVKDREFAFMLPNLHDVYSWDDMNRRPKFANFIKMKAFDCLSSDEKSKLVMMEYTDERQYLQRVCILEKQLPADDFVYCIKLLRIYSVAPSPR